MEEFSDSEWVVGGQAVVPKRIAQMEEAIKNRDFAEFAKITCADSNQFHATCLDTYPPIFYMNDTSRRYRLVLASQIFSTCCSCKFRVHTYRPRAPVWFSYSCRVSRLIGLVERWNSQEGSPQVCTFLCHWSSGTCSLTLFYGVSKSMLIFDSMAHYESCWRLSLWNWFWNANWALGTGKSNVGMCCTVQAAYTFDAGPNAVLFAPNDNVATALLQRLLYLFPPAPEDDFSRYVRYRLHTWIWRLLQNGQGRKRCSISLLIRWLEVCTVWKLCKRFPADCSYVVGDKSILQKAGIKSIEDIDALPTPSEWNGVNCQRTKGELGYLICSKPGPGAVLLDEPSSSLIDSRSGFPNPWYRNGKSTPPYLQCFSDPQWSFTGMGYCKVPIYFRCVWIFPSILGLQEDGGLPTYDWERSVNSVESCGAWSYTMLLSSYTDYSINTGAISVIYMAKLCSTHLLV